MTVAPLLSTYVMIRSSKSSIRALCSSLLGCHGSEQSNNNQTTLPHKLSQLSQRCKIHNH